VRELGRVRPVIPRPVAFARAMEALMDDETCPHCSGHATLLPKHGDREDWECPRCGAFSLSGTDKAMLRPRGRGHLVQGEDGRVWLKPIG
jgi:ribosomal protein S27AE